MGLAGDPPQSPLAKRVGSNDAARYRLRQAIRYALAAVRYVLAAVR